MKKIALVLAITAALLGVVLGILFLMNPLPPASGPPLTITIGGPALESSALIYIAEDQHYFSRNGLNVTERSYDSGGATIVGLLKNEVDIGLMSEYVMANNILKGENISSVSSIDRFDNMFLVGRKDRGTDTIPGLKGKKIGIPRGTIADFYFGRYLELQRMNLGDVSLIDVRPAQTPDALRDGTVDAVVTWHPYLDTIPGQTSGEATVWPIQSGQLTYWNAVCRADWVSAHRLEIDRFLRSLAEAEQFSEQYPAEANRIVQGRLRYNDTYMATIVPDHQFALSLDRGMIAAMRDEVRWTMENNLTGVTRIPNFPDYIYADGLEKVKPGSVDTG